jgi:chromosome segregation ATPase
MTGGCAREPEPDSSFFNAHALTLMRAHHAGIAAIDEVAVTHERLSEQAQPRAELEGNLAQLRREREAMWQELHREKARAQEKDHASEGTQKMLRLLMDERASLTTCFNAMCAAVGSLTKQVTGSNEATAAAATAGTAASTNPDTPSTAAGGQAADYGKAMQHVMAIGGEVGGLRSRVCDLEEKNREQASQLATLTSLLNTVSQQGRREADENAKLKACFGAHAARTAEMERHTASEANRAAELAADHCEAQQCRSATERELVTERYERLKASASLEAVTVSDGHKQAEIDDLESDLKALTAVLGTVVTERDELREDVDLLFAKLELGHPTNEVSDHKGNKVKWHGTGKVRFRVNPVKLEARKMGLYLYQ